MQSTFDRFRLVFGRWCAAALVTLSGVLPCAAQTTSANASADIDLIVPTAAQGSTDIIARLVAEGLGRQGFGAVHVRNLPGRSGSLAGARVAAASPDGRTLLLATPSSHGIASAFESGLPYDPVASFTPILRFAAAPYLLVVKTGRASSLSDFSEQVKNAATPWRYASTGTGGPHHLVAEYYFQRTGLKLEHVPMTGGAAALESLARGGVDAMLPAAILALPRVRAGQLTALAVTGRQRLPSLPDVPTFAEAGIPVDVVSWYGLMAPVGLPADHAARLADAVGRTLGTPAAQAKLRELAAQPTSESGDAFAALIAAEVTQWQSLVRELGIKLDEKGN